MPESTDIKDTIGICAAGVALLAIAIGFLYGIGNVILDALKH